MVQRQLVARGIRSEPVLAAMARVPREEFVSPDQRAFAYDDGALPIEARQTISQPYIVACMTEALDLRPDDKVLEIGTGSGYAAAVLAELAGEVWTIERHGELVALASERLARLGYANVRVIHADGTKGWPDAAPFDAIVAAAGGPQVPDTLRRQLADGGRLVMPIGDDPREQRLVRVLRTDAGWRESDLGAVRFVPLLGEEGWETDEPVV